MQPVDSVRHTMRSWHLTLQELPRARGRRRIRVPPQKPVLRHGCRRSVPYSWLDSERTESDTRSIRAAERSETTVWSDFRKEGFRQDYARDKRTHV